MTPEKARVFIAEDTEIWRGLYEDLLQDGGHIIVRSSATLDEAFEALEELEDGEIDVAIVDGNLNERDTSGKDGARITKMIKEKFTNVKVIGVSGLSAPWADVSINKLNVGDNLVNEINEA